MFPGCGVALLPARPVDLRAQGEGVVEYPGKVACPSGRRCSTRNAVWCHSHPGFKSQRYRHCRPAPLGPGGFVMPTWRVRVLGLLCSAGCCLLLVACGPSGVAGAGGPGRCVCRWAAARPRAVRAASFARRVVSKPGQAPPPPTGTAAGPSGALHTGGVCLVRRLGAGQAPPPPAGAAASPSGPSGALHTGSAWCADCWLGTSARCPARPRRRPRAPQPVPPVRSMCVVTNVVNRRCFSCGFLIGCYKRRHSDGFLAENGGFLA